MKQILSLVCLTTMYFVVAVVFHFARSSDGKYAFSTLATQTLSEFVKLCISVCLLKMEIGDRDVYVTYKNQMTTSCMLYSIVLSIFYCINNQIMFVLFTMIPAVVITLIKTTSPLITALITLFVLHQGRPTIAWVALLIQVLGLIVAQYNACDNTPTYHVMSYAIGILSVTISSSAGVANSSLLKAYAKTISMHSINITMYITGMVVNYIVFLCGSKRFFDNFTPTAILIVLCNSCLGIAVTFVYKYADAITKTLAQSVNICALLFFGPYIFGTTIGVVEVCGVFVVCCATYIYVKVNRTIPLTHISRTHKISVGIIVILTLMVMNSERQDVVIVSQDLPITMPPTPLPTTAPPTPSPIKQTHVAICITGAARTIDRPFVYKNIAENIKSMGGTTRLFMLLKMNDDQKGKMKRHNVNSTTMTVVTDYLQPAIYHEDTNKYNTGVGCHKKLDKRVMPQFAPIARCREMARQYGLENNIEFKWFVRMRADVVYLDPLPKIETFNNSYVTAPVVHTSSSINDHFLVSSWENSIYFEKITEYLTNGCPNIGIGNAETVLQKTIQSLGIGIKKIPIFEVIVRPSGLECVRRHDKKERERCKKLNSNLT